jgi:hypothetical protein
MGATVLVKPPPELTVSTLTHLLVGAQVSQAITSPR